MIQVTLQVVKKSWRLQRERCPIILTHWVQLPIELQCATRHKENFSTDNTEKYLACKSCVKIYVCSNLQLKQEASHGAPKGILILLKTKIMIDLVHPHFLWSPMHQVSNHNLPCRKYRFVSKYKMLNYPILLKNY